MFYDCRPFTTPFPSRTVFLIPGVKMCVRSQPALACFMPGHGVDKVVDLVLKNVLILIIKKKHRLTNNLKAKLLNSVFAYSKI